MYKNLSIAVLLVAFGLVGARSTGTPAPTLTSPTIVKKVVLANQTAPIPTTAIFTPGTSGLFRVSVYMTQVVSTPSLQDQSLWNLQLSWTDSAGAETLNGNGLVNLGSSQAPPSAFGNANSSQITGTTGVIEAIAGQPVNFSVVETLNPLVGGGTYSLYLVLERLI